MNFALRIAARLSDIPAEQWDALVTQSHGGVLHPALRHAFLNAMETSGDVSQRTGWVPRHLCLYDEQNVLVAAAPAYLKYHSYGEYVFDWAWADAYHRNQLEYYPKLLTAIPYTPVFGNRLLARNPECRTFLVEAITRLLASAATDASLLGECISSWHGLFLDEQTLPPAAAHTFLKRDTVQFHWRNAGSKAGTNAGGKPYESFDAFLQTLTQKKRKNILAERRKVREAGIVVQAVTGHDITPDELDFFYRCYANTYHEHRSTPYLSPAFFQSVVKDMPQQLVFFFARRVAAQADTFSDANAILKPDAAATADAAVTVDASVTADAAVTTNAAVTADTVRPTDSQPGTPLAASLCLQSDTTLYGRYWGSVEHVACLHFETAYYAPLQWAIEQGLQCFEGGAQGEHKMSRGFLPVPASSRHWLAHPAFADAIERYLQRESAGISSYLDELESHPPFRQISGRETE